MRCWTCDTEACGVCIFCGRGVCKKHVTQAPSIITVYVGKEHTPKAIVVADALNCGICKPQPSPLEMPEIY